MSDNQLYWEIVAQTRRELIDWFREGPALQWHPITKEDLLLLLKTWTESDHKLWETISAKHSLLKFEAITKRKEDQDDQDKNEKNEKGDKAETVAATDDNGRLDRLLEGIYKEALMEEVKNDTNDEDFMHESREWSLKEMMSLVTILAAAVSAISLVMWFVFLCRIFTAKTTSDYEENWLEFLFTGAVLLVLAQVYFDLHYSCSGRIRFKDIVRDIRLYDMIFWLDFSALVRQLFVYLPDTGLFDIGIVCYITAYLSRVSIQFAILFLLRRSKSKCKRLDTRLKKLFDYCSKEKY